MSKYFKIDYRVRQLTNTQAIVYFYIVKMITDKMKINRAYITKCLGNYDPDSVSPHIKAIAKAGLINLGYKFD